MASHAKETAPGELVPVKFSRLTRRGVLLGLSVAQLVTLGIGGLTLIGAFYAGGGMLLAYTAPVWVLCAALTRPPRRAPRAGSHRRVRRLRAGRARRPARR